MKGLEFEPSGVKPAPPFHVLVAVASAHRGSAFQACEFLMDHLKTQAPFWKKETTAEGARWVDARVSDDAAMARWQVPAVAVLEAVPSNSGGSA